MITAPLGTATSPSIITSTAASSFVFAETAETESAENWESSLAIGPTASADIVEESAPLDLVEFVGDVAQTIENEISTYDNIELDFSAVSTLVEDIDFASVTANADNFGEFLIGPQVESLVTEVSNLGSSLQLGYFEVGLGSFQNIFSPNLEDPQLNAFFEIADNYHIAEELRLHGSLLSETGNQEVDDFLNSVASIEGYDSSLQNLDEFFETNFGSGLPTVV